MSRPNPGSSALGCSYGDKSPARSRLPWDPGFHQAGTPSLFLHVERKETVFSPLPNSIPLGSAAIFSHLIEKDTEGQRVPVTAGLLRARGLMELSPVPFPHLGILGAPHV